MDVTLLARIQFALTIGFHYIFPPMSIGLGLILVIMEWRYFRTKNIMYEHMVKFWTKVLALTFGVGVATGIVMEFEFGTNWATYSRYVGDIFGSPLAAEGIFAFFMESTFLGILLFGWNRVGPKIHFFSTIMVALGSTLSSFWIIVANSWMQTPAGYHIVGQGVTARAEITDFWAMVFNPSTIERFLHTVSAAWLTGAFLVMSIAAYYLIKKVHIDFSKSTLKIGISLAIFASLFQLYTGHHSSIVVLENQPVKLAAFEGHYHYKPMDLFFMGWVQESKEKVFGVGIPDFTSYLIYGNMDTPIKGLNSFPKEDWPPIQFVFQSYHIMVALGMLMIMLSLIGVFLWWKKKLPDSKWFLYLLVPSFILPQIGNLTGWASAEVGRQPWIVQGILRTNDAISKVVSSGQIIFSIIMFSVIYIILLLVFLYLLIKKIKQGPEDWEPMVE